jgi:hypothetical protein
VTTLLLVVPGVMLGGCGVPEDGWVGVGRNPDGQFEVYVRTCEHALDGSTLYWPDDPAGNSEAEVFGEWTFQQGGQGATRVEWPLLGQGQNEVTALRPVAQLPDPPKNMAIYAWTRDASASAGGPYQFTAADLNELRPGQVLVDNNTGNESDPRNKAISRKAFDALDCAAFG